MNTDKPTLEAMPQYVARLEEKVDALTEIVTKLSESLAKAAAPIVEPFIDTMQACALLNLSKSRIYALVGDGTLPHYMPGKNLLFLASELRAYQERSKKKGQDSIEEQMETMTKGMKNSARKNWK